MAVQDEEIDDVKEKGSLVYKKQLKSFDDYIRKNKQRTSIKRIPANESFRQRSPSSPLSIRFPLQETIAERVKLERQERKKQEQD